MIATPISHICVCEKCRPEGWKPIHGHPVPDNVPNDFRCSPPVPCSFNVGDKVTFVNDYGVKFPGKTVRGFTEKVTTWGAFIYIDSLSWWCPVKPDELVPE